MRRGTWFFGAISGLLAAACGGNDARPTTQADIAHTALARKCEPSAGARRLYPIGSRGAGSTVSLATMSGRTLALVADEDDHAIQIIDVDRNERGARTVGGGVPGQLLVPSDGRVLVTLTDQNRVAVFEASDGSSTALEARCSAGTDVDPIGLAATPGESTVLVTSRTGRTLALYSAATLTRTAETETPRDPYSVTVSADGKTAFVSHVAGGRMTAVSLGDKLRVKDVTLETQPDPRQRRQIRQLEANLERSGMAKVQAAKTALENSFGVTHRKAVQGFAIARSDKLARIYAPVVLVDPGDPAQRTAGYGAGSVASEIPAVAVLDRSEERRVGKESRSRWT